jgi:hypothetical protein
MKHLASAVLVGVVILLCLSMCACATKPAGCPNLPNINDEETLKDYTVHVIQMYKECQAVKNGDTSK